MPACAPRRPQHAAPVRFVGPLPSTPVARTPASATPTPSPSPPSADDLPSPSPDAHALRNGIDDGYPLTKTGRTKRKYSKRSDEPDPNDIYRHRYLATHIQRGFDLFGYIPGIINNGIMRRARQEIGESIEGIMSFRDWTTFEKIINHIPGLDADIVRYCDDPLTFRDLVQGIQDSAHNARSNDVCNVKKDLGYLLIDDNAAVVQNITSPCMGNDKSCRGFHDDITGRYLCPTIYDWDNVVERQKLRDGNYAVTADVFPRLLYAGCMFDPNDLESGLGRNMALLRAVKYIFTGRSSAISSTPGGKTTRAGNAQLAGMTRITPNVIAYGACILRFALSSTATWCKIDMEFDMEVFYWNIVDIFHDDQFSNDLLAWWNAQVFGISLDTGHPAAITPPPMSSMSVLMEQRAAKRARLSKDDDIRGSSADRQSTGASSPAAATPALSSNTSSQPTTAQLAYRLPHNR